MKFSSRGVGTVGLWGMGGSGKSTVARAFFAEQSQAGTFERRILMAVGQSAKGQQLVEKQRELVGELARGLGRSSAEELQATSSALLTAQIANMMGQQAGPLLLVLDDLWSAYQLRALGGDGIDQLPEGSRVLLTTRRRDVVTGRNPVQQPLLSDHSAKALLAWHACEQERLPAELAYSSCVSDALGMCKGLPLAVKVLGGMLRRVSAVETQWQVRDADEWAACSNICRIDAW